MSATLYRCNLTSVPADALWAKVSDGKYEPANAAARTWLERTAGRWARSFRVLYDDSMEEVMGDGQSDGVGGTDSVMGRAERAAVRVGYEVTKQALAEARERDSTQARIAALERDVASLLRRVDGLTAGAISGTGIAMGAGVNAQLQALADRNSAVAAVVAGTIGGSWLGAAGVSAQRARVTSADIGRTYRVTEPSLHAGSIGKLWQVIGDRATLFVMQAAVRIEVGVAEIVEVEQRWVEVGAAQAQVQREPSPRMVAAAVTGVPREPTQEMIKAGLSRPTHRGDVPEIWRAMWDAAQ